MQLQCVQVEAQPKRKQPGGVFLLVLQRRIEAVTGQLLVGLIEEARAIQTVSGHSDERPPDAVAASLRTRHSRARSL